VNATPAIATHGLSKSFGKTPNTVFVCPACHSRFTQDGLQKAALDAIDNMRKSTDSIQ